MSSGGDINRTYAEIAQRKAGDAWVAGDMTAYSRHLGEVNYHTTEANRWDEIENDGGYEQPIARTSETGLGSGAKIFVAISVFFISIFCIVYFSSKNIQDIHETKSDHPKTGEIVRMVAISKLVNVMSCKNISCPIVFSLKKDDVFYTHWEIGDLWRSACLKEGSPDTGNKCGYFYLVDAEQNVVAGVDYRP